MTRFISYSLLLLALVGAGCSDDPDVDDGSLLDAFVVVQENNMPCRVGSCDSCEEGQMSYSSQVARECGPGLAANILICSDEELCQAQVDLIVEEVRSCSTTDAEFEYQVPAVCED